MRRPHVKVNITTNDDCQERALGGVKIESSMLCAGGEGTGSGLVSKNYNHIMYFKFTIFLFREGVKKMVNFRNLS